MSIFNRLRARQERRAYEKSVLFRERHTPYGTMYAQVAAYHRDDIQHGRRRDDLERHKAARLMKERARAAFMSHPAATLEDFERCWPSIRDELFKQYALSRLRHETVEERQASER